MFHNLELEPTLLTVLSIIGAYLMGSFPGIVVGVLDVLKGLSVVLLAKLLNLSLLGIIFVATAAVIGHCWSVFLRFHGGQGLGTAVGVLIPLLSVELILTLLAGILVAFVGRFLLKNIVRAHCHHSFIAPIVLQEDFGFSSMNSVSSVVKNIFSKG